MRAITNKDGSITLAADSGADAYLLEPFANGVKVSKYWQGTPVSIGGEITKYPLLRICPLEPNAREENDGQTD